MKHTPGPWLLSTIPFELRTHDSAGSIYGPVSIKNGACLIADTSRSPGDEQATANARLIAAAPDLLDALENCVRVMENLEKAGSVAFTQSGVYKDAKEAISKAIKI